MNKESKRQHCVRLYKQGWNISDIAKQVSSTKEWVKIWLKDYIEKDDR